MYALKSEQKRKPCMASLEKGEGKSTHQKSMESKVTLPALSKISIIFLSLEQHQSCKCSSNEGVSGTLAEAGPYSEACRQQGEPRDTS